MDNDPRQTAEPRSAYPEEEFQELHDPWWIPWLILLTPIVVFLLTALTAQGQWLPRDIQQRDKALWESTGVEFPTQARFYELTKVSQNLFSFDYDVFGIYNHKFRGDGPSAVNDEYPWTTPAGLATSPPDQWRVARVASFPAPVVVFRNRQGVLNGLGSRQPQTFIDWSFPDGTIFAEMLVRKYQGMEWPFEIRMRTKQGGKWDDGVTYRPITSKDQLPKGSEWGDYVLDAGKLKDFGIRSLEVKKVYHLPPRSLALAQWSKFKASRLTVTAVDDDSAYPRDYRGNVTRCITCHSKAGESTSYGATTIRGNDTILSWHPFTLDTLGQDVPPVLDQRWPLVNEAGLRSR
jgi:hypothetical protein